MDTWNNTDPDRPSFLAEPMFRGGAVLLGVFGVFWSTIVCPALVTTAPLRALSARIIADERFRPGALEGIIHRAEPSAEPSVVPPEFAQAKALTSLRLAEETGRRGSSEEANRAVDVAFNNLKSALAAAPVNSFLWLLIYSVENARAGFDPQNVRYLDRSYADGPFEGWIALRRNRLSLAIFPVLSDEIQQAVISEFVGLVDSGFTDEAAENLTTVGWKQQGRLLPALEQADLARRQSFVRRLSRDGYKVAVPGIELSDRPWR